MEGFLHDLLLFSIEPHSCKCGADSGDQVGGGRPGRGLRWLGWEDGASVGVTR